ncbi:MAG: hypothetical protein DRJ62_00120 [Thermoprotei archaeon]|nr:MAG: hypothetical protein DRJ62_00120 [Thermoprotei archaeon]
MNLIVQYMTYFAYSIVWIFIGIFIANAVVEFGLSRYVAKPFKPIVKTAKMPPALSSVLALSIIDSRAAHSALSSLYGRGFMGDWHVVACFMIMTPFGAVPLLARHFIPLAYALLGPYVATLYLLAVFSSLFIRMSLGILVARRLKWRQEHLDLATHVNCGKKVILRDILKSTAKFTWRIGLRLFLVSWILIILTYFGFFNYINTLIEPFITNLGLRGEVAAIAATRAVSPSAGVYVAGQLMAAQELSVKDVLVGLLLGTLLFLLTSDYPRHIFPYHSSIYNVKLAAKLTAIGMSLSAAFFSLIITILLIFF